MRVARTTERTQIVLRCAVLGAVLLAGAGCQHVPLAPIDPAANAAKISARSLADPAVRAALAEHALAPDATDSWTLDQLTLAAWTLRTDLAVARSEVGAARAATFVDGQHPNPTLSNTNERVTNGNPDHPWVLGVALGLTLETGGKRAIRRDRALAQERTLEWQFGEALWSTRAAVRTALVDLVLARQLADLDASETELTSGYLSWVETRLARGAATASERLAARQTFNESASRQELDKIAVASAAATLAAAVGVPRGEIDRVQPSLPPFETLRAIADSDLNAARQLAVVNRLDVRRALAEYEVAEQDIRAAMALQYPDLTLAPGYTVDQADHKITLGLDLPVPLFHGAKPAIQQAIAKRRLAAAKFDDVQAAALAVIDVGVAQYASSRNALAAAERAERDAAEQVTAVQRSLSAGAASRGEVLAQEITLAGLRRATLAARRAVIDAVTALENGIERPLFPDSAIDPATAVNELLVSGP